VRGMSGGVQGGFCDDGGAGLLQTEQLSAEHHNMHSHKSRSTEQYIGNQSGIPYGVGRGMGCSEFAVHGPERQRSSWSAELGDGERRECRRRRCRVACSFRRRANINFDLVAISISTVDFYNLQHYEVFWGNEGQNSSVYQLGLATRTQQLVWDRICRRNLV
jgi:hypothetical protein